MYTLDDDGQIFGISIILHTTRFFLWPQGHYLLVCIIPDPQSTNYVYI